MNSRFKNLFAVTFVACLDNFGIGLVMILFAPLVFNPEYSIVSPNLSVPARNFLLAASLAAFPLTQFFGASFFGNYADQIGRKKALLHTIGGTIAGYVLSAIAIIFKSMVFLIFSRLVTGFFAGNIAISLAVLSDLTGKDKSRGSSYGNLSIAYGAVWTLAIIVGGFLSNPKIVWFFSPLIPFLFTVFLGGIAYFLVQILFTETSVNKNSIHTSLLKDFSLLVEMARNKTTRSIFLLIFVWALGWGLSMQWFSAYSIEKFGASESAISVFFLIQGVCWSFGGSVFNPLFLKNFSISTTAILGFISTAIFLILPSSVDTFLALEIFLSLGSITSSIAMSNSLALLSLASPDSNQGAAMGLGQSTIACGLIIVPFIGSLLGTLNLNLIYPFCSVMLIVGTAIIIFLVKKLRWGDG